MSIEYFYLILTVLRQIWHIKLWIDTADLTYCAVIGDENIVHNQLKSWCKTADSKQALNICFCKTKI
jgi:hypothetical protein